jgi:CHASE3 domain sensor protein
MNTATDNPNRQQNLDTENPELRRQIAELQRQIAERDARDHQRDADEEIITEKMRKGLNREQAIAVIHRQREFDAAKVSRMPHAELTGKPRAEQGIKV